MAFPVDEQYIRAAEKELGVVFPPIYRQYLSECNGGELGEFTLFPVWDTSERKRLVRTSNHIVRETEAAREWSGFPADVQPIAYCSGDYLVLRADDSGALSDTIWLWEHDGEGELLREAEDIRDYERMAEEEDY